MTSLTFRVAACAAALICSITGAAAQMTGADLTMRLDRIENQMRQLTGVVEQLQFRNQQLETQLRKMQEDTEYRFQELSGRGGGGAPAAAPQPRQPAQSAPGRRGDAFDPSRNPDAPGVPRTLGAGPNSAPVIAGPPVNGADETVGVPGGRTTGAPLDLSTLASNAVTDPSLAPRGGPPAGNAPPPGTQQALATLPPTQSPRDVYDLGHGYVLRKDYALGEQTLRVFLQRYPDDKLASDAEYWLGESLFQRQQYREAAEAFLKVSTKYETAPKAPDALLRLGQSLAAMGEKETACASLSQVGLKYPRASVGVKQNVDREQKRIKC